MLPEEQDKADRTLRGACIKLTRQQFYNQKHTSINQFSSESLGKKVPKHLRVEDKPILSKDDYNSVSKLSMRFYVVA